MNHPLNNIGYQGLRQRLISVLGKLEEYIDYMLKAEKVQDCTLYGPYYWAENNEQNGFVVLKTKDNKTHTPGDFDSPSVFICTADTMEHAMSIASLLNGYGSKVDM